MFKKRKTQSLNQDEKYKEQLLYDAHDVIQIIEPITIRKYIISNTIKRSNSNEKQGKQQGDIISNRKLGKIELLIPHLRHCWKITYNTAI